MRVALDICPIPPRTLLPVKSRAPALETTANVGYGRCKVANVASNDHSMKIFVPAVLAAAVPGRGERHGPAAQRQNDG